MDKIENIRKKMIESEKEAERELEEKQAIVDATINEPIVEEEKHEIVAVEKEKKSITDITLSDVKVAIDTTKSAGQQTEEVIDFAATVAAAQDNETVKKIGDAKKEEIVTKAVIKAKEAEQKSIDADTELQKAKMQKFELLFETFGVTKHIPDWLLTILMCIFAPFYIAFVIVIGIPTGFVRFLVDAIDGILVRYDETEQGRKPRLKVTVWVVLALIVVAAIVMTILGCLHII